MPTVGQQTEIKSSNNHRVQNQGLDKKNKKKCHIFTFITDAGK